MPYIPLGKEEINARIKELQARITQIDRREQSLADLKKWMERHKLQPLDLLWMYRQMTPKRAAKPVKSKKPLQPARLHPYERGNGVAFAEKGDPEFRRAIRERREELGLSYDAVAQGAGGMSHATIRGWEAGRYVPTEPNRVRLLTFLKLPLTLGAEATAQSFKGRPPANSGAQAE